MEASARRQANGKAAPDERAPGIQTPGRQAQGGAPSPPKTFRPTYGAGASPFANLVPTPPKASGLGGTITSKLNAFAARKGNGKWPHLPRANIAARLKTLATDKAGAVEVYQDGLNACGPAAAMYLFAREKPEAFADLGMALYDDGNGSFGSLTIAGTDLFAHDPLSWKAELGASGGTFHTGLAVDDWLADWMLLSSLRHSEDRASNAWTKFDGKPDDGVSGITWPGDMVKWLEKGVGFAAVKDETSLVFNKDLDHLKKLAPDADTTVVLLINFSVLQGGKKKKDSASKSWEHGKGLKMFPDHYAVLDQRVPGNDTDKVKVWSWGRMMDLPELGDTDKWEEAYFGAIIARRMG